MGRSLLRSPSKRSPIAMLNSRFTATFDGQHQWGWAFVNALLSASLVRTAHAKSKSPYVLSHGGFMTRKVLSEPSAQNRPLRWTFSASADSC